MKPSRLVMLAAATALWVPVTRTARAEDARPLELARLSVFVGKWNVVVDMAASGVSPAGKFVGINAASWEFDGYFLVMRIAGKENGRPMSEIQLLGWDPEGKRFTYDSFNSFGRRSSFRGTVSGDTWTWSSETMAGGAKLQVRYVQRFASNEVMTFKIETSTDGAHWTTAVTGRATRAIP